jgi:ssRNA-specific RNase YbeY (16S rRNA maturation enzyme)
MKLDLVFLNSTADSKFTKKFFEDILLACIKELKLGNKKIGISVNLVGESKIKELNKRYRNKNKITDVLSFPMSENVQSLSAYKLISSSAFDLGDVIRNS